MTRFLKFWLKGKAPCKVFLSLELTGIGVAKNGSGSWKALIYTEADLADLTPPPPGLSDGFCSSEGDHGKSPKRGESSVTRKGRSSLTRQSAVWRTETMEDAEH